MDSRVAIAVMLGIMLAIDPMSASAQTEQPTWRTWSDATGKFSIEAAFVKFEEGRVFLRRKDGQLVSVSAGKLSRADQQHVRELLAAKRTAEPKPTGPAADDWPFWRGPNHNGVAADGQTPPVEWNDEKNVLWKVSVPGRGHSSPTIVGNRIFLTTAREKEQLQSVLCFDRESGEQRWETDLNLGGFPKRIHNKNTHASPTVSSDGERVFAAFMHHDKIEVAALALASGRLQWRKTAGPYVPRQYEYGYAASPLIYKDSLIVVSDCDSDAFLTALDCATGDERWRTERQGKISWSSPIVGRVAGRDQLLLSGCDQVCSYDPETGEVLWSTAATTAATCGTMIWEGDLVFASGGYPKAQTVCIRADGSGEIVWQNKQKCYEQSMLVHDGHVYAVTDGGIAYCWRASDGMEMWNKRLGGPVSASPVLADGNIYCSNERGTTFVFRADPKQFKLVAENQLGDEAFATPTICGSRIYLRVAAGSGEGRQEFLYCIGARE